MRKVCVALLVALLAGPVIADPPWEKKKPEQWSKKEVEKILTDSPWAKRTIVPYSPLESGEGLETGVTVVDIKNRRSNDPNDDLLTEAPTRATPQSDRIFFVRWLSSKTIQQARERQVALGGQPSKSTLPKKYTPAPDEIFIEVSGTPIDPLPAAQAVRLQKNSYLLVGKDKWKVEPVRVDVRWAVGGTRPEAFEFYFSRKTQTGRELVTEDETLVEFVGHAGPRVFSAKFNPGKMKARGGMDF